MHPSPVEVSVHVCTSADCVCMYVCVCMHVCLCMLVLANADIQYVLFCDHSTDVLVSERAVDVGDFRNYMRQRRRDDCAQLKAEYTVSGADCV